MTPEEIFKNAGIDGQEFRGAPFWSWNDDLDPEELRGQIRGMHDAGMGGFFMHSRTGLITPYMSEKYLECHDACIDEARKLGMGAWLYDEDCWPSGNAGDISPGRGPEYRSKALMCDSVRGGSPAPENPIAVFRARREGDKLAEAIPSSLDELAAASPDEEFLVVRVQIGDYVDTLWPKAIESFIDVTHEQFKQHYKSDFGGVVPGIFTDEPSWGWNTPWTNRFPEEFEARRGYDLKVVLPSIFFEIGDFNKVRYDFYRTAMELYVEAFSKQIGEWCDKENMIFTGHQVCEDALSMQTLTVGAVMPHYEYMQMPGMDLVLAWIRDPIVPKQVTSVAHQLGKKRVLTETFACGGWNESFEEMKWTGEWQYTLGVNFMCQHLLLYSLRGCRKRDYPPSIFYQQPWWPDYKMFEDHFARLAAALTSGKHVADALLIHPIESTWAIYDPAKTWMQDETFSRLFADVSDALLECHIDYDYGDESLMEKYARVEGDRLIVGECEYKLVVLPPMRTIRRNTLRLISEFVANGGKVICVAGIPTMLEGEWSDEPAKVLRNQPQVKNTSESIRSAALNAVPPRVTVSGPDGDDAKKILVHQRDLGGKQLFFFANTDRDNDLDARIAFPGAGLIEQWDLDTGDIKPVACALEEGMTVVSLPFAPTGSHLIAFDPSKEPLIGQPEKWSVVSETDLGGTWSVTRHDPNALTLDFCRYKIADGEWSELTHTIHLEDHLADVAEETPVTLRFVFNTRFSEQKPRDMRLVMEIPEAFEVTLNGQSVDFTNSEWWTDISFRTASTDRIVRDGENIVELKCRNYLGRTARQQRIKDIDLMSYLGRAYTHPPADVKDPIILPFTGEVADLQRQVNELKYGIELESIYVIGDFDVVRDGSGFVLTDATNTVEAGDLVEQGYTFYRGTVTCKQTVNMEKKAGERILLTFDKPGAIIIKARVNGKDAGHLAWRPFELDITECVVDGSNDIEIELINSCRNLLGPHHTVEGQRIGVGARSFKGNLIWEGIYTVGDRFYWGDFPEPGEEKVDWTDEYVFVPFGFVTAPKLKFLEL